MVRWVYRGLCALALLVSVAACTTDQQNRVVAQAEERWREQNKFVLFDLGEKRFAAKPVETLASAGMALSDLGFRVDVSNARNGIVSGTVAANRVLSADEWARVKSVHDAELRSIAFSTLGPAASFVNVNPDPYEVRVKVQVFENGSGSRAAIEFAMAHIGQKTPGRIYNSQPPPTALKMGLEKLWARVDTDLPRAIALNPNPAPSQPQTAAPPAPAAPAPARPASPQPTPTAAAAPSNPPRLRIVGSGSGFVVSEGYVLTNFHVAGECDALGLRIPPDLPVEGAMVAGDQRNDLAIIKLLKPYKAPIATFRQDSIRQGENVVAFGFPLYPDLAESVNLSFGAISATSGMGNDARHVQISAPIQPGNSGGPLLDSSGNVVGIVSSGLNAAGYLKNEGIVPQNVNFAIKSNIAMNFLEANAIRFQARTSATELRNADIADAARRFTTLIECYQMR